MVSEMKRLASPASVDSIPSSAMQEDHVSMGWHAARKLRRSLEAFADVVAIEIVAASRALALRAPLSASPATAAVVDLVNDVTGGPGPDRWLSPELSAVGQMVRSGEILAAARRFVDVR
jgi:histidine ammonia-lyase